jgi:hypothetical protein
VVTTEDLVRRFAGLEQRGLAAAGISTDESARLKRSTEVVEELTRSVARNVEAIANAVDQTWTELQLVYGEQTAGVRGILDSSLDDKVAILPPRGSVLGLSSAAFRGNAGLVTLQIERRETSLHQLSVPLNVCEFIIFAEPHALNLASYRVPGGDGNVTSESIQLPLDPALWRQADISRFLIQEIDRFREATEAAIREQNRGP